MEPWKLQPAFKDYLWGGTRLTSDFGMESGLAVTAEAWVLSCHPDGANRVVTGPHRGETLAQAIEAEGAACLGTRAAGFADFPVLIKLIDARDNLSVQVHPDDAYARRVEGESGKTEAWYILDCEPGAELIYGFAQEISREEFRRRIEDNTLLAVLNRVPVKKGDLFFIEAGTLHAIGKGILLAEVQQSSNSTYRVYDYGRVGADGKPRPLHIDKAVDVTRCVPPARPAKPQGEPVPMDGYVETLLVSCPLFTARSLAVETRACREAGTDSFVSLLIVSGEGRLVCGEHTTAVQKGDSFFLPAGCGAFQLEGKLEALETRI